MKVLGLPFTSLYGIIESKEAGCLLLLPENTLLLNHLDTIHASALYALAEISSGYYLQTNFSAIADFTIPILRASKARYRRRAHGDIHSRAVLLHTSNEQVQSELIRTRKVILTIEVSLLNKAQEEVMLSRFEWFITLQDTFQTPDE